jgi:hypothetical protein
MVVICYAFLKIFGSLKNKFNLHFLFNFLLFKIYLIWNEYFGV